MTGEAVSRSVDVNGVSGGWPSNSEGDVVVGVVFVEGGLGDGCVDALTAHPPCGSLILITAHIDFGKKSKDRIPELESIAKWMSDWADKSTELEHNLLVLGDFNIDRKDDDLWKAFTSTGLASPADLDHVKRSIFVKDNGDPRLDKFYDQIAWFGDDAGRKALSMTSKTESKDEDLAIALRSSLSSEVGRRRTRPRT